MKKKYQVFVSSTYSDLIEERNAAIQCLLDNDCIPVGMEQFPASDMSQMDYIQKMLDDCDYYILILGGRYGSLDKDGIGFTEKEYDYAIAKGMPVMSFVFDKPEQLPACKCDGNDMLRNKFKNFRYKVCASRLVKFHSNVGELKANIATSINKCIKDFPAIGWVRISDDLCSQNVSEISKATGFYANKDYINKFTFDYSNNNGCFTIGEGDYIFKTHWSKASDVCIHAYNDYVDGIARMKSPVNIIEKIGTELDFSSRARTAYIGDAIVWRNKNGKYAITKIIDIKDDSRGAEHDELTCEYIILK